MTLHKIKYLVKKSEFHKALDLFEGENPSIQKEIIKIEILRELGDFKKCRDLLETLMKEDLTPEYTFAVLVEKSYLEYRRDHLIKAKSSILKAESLFSSLKNKNTFVREFETKMNAVLGNINWKNGRLNKAEKYYKLALVQSRTESLRLHQLHAMICISNIHADKGEYEKALEYLKQVNTDAKLIGNKKYLAYAENNMGEIYRVRGNYKIALDHYHKASELSITMENNYLNGLFENNLGICYFELGEFHNAKQFFESALLKLIEVPSYTIASEVLLYLIRINLVQEKNNVENYLNELKSYAENVSSQLISIRYNLARAIIYKHRQRPQDLDRAIELLKDITNRDVILFELVYVSNLHLIEIHVIQFLRGDTTLQNTILTLISDLKRKVKENKSKILYFKLLFLDAKLQRLFEKEEQIKYILQQFQNHKKKHNGLTSLIDEMLDNFHKDLEKVGKLKIRIIQQSQEELIHRCSRIIMGKTLYP